MYMTITSCLPGEFGELLAEPVREGSALCLARSRYANNSVA